ncbi:MAG: hypothetical protein KIS96_03375 [Bauldia sp.]|nr:hypothetical protein [Bauldia sp.]
MTTPDDFADLREALAKIDAIRTNEATPFSARKEHIADLSVDLGLTFTEAIAALLAAYDAALSRAEKAETALRFYADEWEAAVKPGDTATHEGPTDALWADRGERARALLRETAHDPGR